MIIASILSAVILVAYGQIVGKVSPRGGGPLTSQQNLANKPDADKKVMSVGPSEETISLQSSYLSLEVGKESGSVHEIVVKKFLDLGGKNFVRFGGTYTVLAVGCSEDIAAKWRLKAISTGAGEWVCEKDGILTELKISVNKGEPTFSIELTSSNKTEEVKSVPTRILGAWGHGDPEIGVQKSPIEVVLKSAERRSFQRSYLLFRDGQVKNVPREIDMVTLSERFFCLSLNLQGENKTKASIIASPHGSVAVLVDQSRLISGKSSVTYSIPVYVGPRDFFHLRECGFEKALPLGFLGKIGLILMLILNWLASVTGSYGVGIIMLSMLVTLSLSPFTLISLRSMKKLQFLQPKIDSLRKKYEKDQAKLNKEMFALFKEHRVSPLGGCLPMLLPLPIFFALWSAISHVIELRGKSFLWIRDLTLPDRLATLPAGLTINLLPILMIGTMVVQTKLSQRNMPRNDANRMFSGPLMSVIFGVMFYQVPACLVLYWLANSLVTIAIYILSARNADAEMRSGYA